MWGKLNKEYLLLSLYRVLSLPLGRKINLLLISLLSGQKYFWSVHIKIKCQYTKENSKCLCGAQTTINMFCQRGCLQWLHPQELRSCWLQHPINGCVCFCGRISWRRAMSRSRTSWSWWEESCPAEPGWPWGLSLSLMCTVMCSCCSPGECCSQYLGGLLERAPKMLSLAWISLYRVIAQLFGKWGLFSTAQGSPIYLEQTLESSYNWTDSLCKTIANSSLTWKPAIKCWITLT